MNFLVHCECGAPARVSEGSAGAKIPCGCGRTITVPPLHVLRAELGQPPSLEPGHHHRHVVLAPLLVGAGHQPLRGPDRVGHVLQHR